MSVAEVNVRETWCQQPQPAIEKRLDYYALKEFSAEQRLIFNEDGYALAIAILREGNRRGRGCSVDLMEPVDQPARPNRSASKECGPDRGAGRSLLLCTKHGELIVESQPGNLGCRHFRGACNISSPRFKGGRARCLNCDGLHALQRTNQNFAFCRSCRGARHGVDDQGKVACSRRNTVRQPGAQRLICSLYLAVGEHNLLTVDVVALPIEISD